MNKSIQLTEQGNLKHFISIEGLNQELLTKILDTAAGFLSVTDQSVKKVPLLRGKTIVNLFFEASTRTRTTFELAAKRLSADVLTINLESSSTKKGESLLDTIRNIQAMNADMFIVRHNSSGAPYFIAEHVAPHISVINAGDGCHSHPTQAMLDMFTIRHFKNQFRSLKVAIVGDILHSRVARSQIHALNILGVSDVRIIAPKTLLPRDLDGLGVKIYNQIEQGLEDVDVVIMLRLQNERMQAGLLPSTKEYYQLYGLTKARLQYAKKDAIVMHPGPINRGVEIASDVADGSHSVILQQVHFGIAVRMAVMSMTLSNQSMRTEEHLL